MSRMTELLKANGINIEDVFAPAFIGQVVSLFSAYAPELVAEHNLEILKGELRKCHMPEDMIERLVSETYSKEKLISMLVISTMMGMVEVEQADQAVQSIAVYRHLKEEKWTEPSKAALIRLILSLNLSDQTAERTITVGRYTLHQKDGWFKIDESPADLHSGTE